MKTILVIIFLTVCSQLYGQNNNKYYYVQKIDTNRVTGLTLLDGRNFKSSVYKINFRGDSSFQTYPLENLSYNNTIMDTLAMIRELLSFKGDKRLCVLPIIHYGHGIWGRTYHSVPNNNITDYSIQVEALFLINQLFFANPFSEYSGCPVLLHYKRNRINTIDGAIIDKAYECYEEWFKQINKCGLDYARKNKIFPLDNCKSIEWY